MVKKQRRYSTGRKIAIAVVIIILLAGIAFQLFINRYLPPLVKQRLSEIIVKGSDSLYKFEVGKFDVSFWKGGIYFSDMHINIDSVRYNKMKTAKKLPALTFNINIPGGSVNNLDLINLVFSKKIDVRLIHFDEAEVMMARHFRNSQEKITDNIPLWQLIRPDIQSIKIDEVRCANLKMNYRNIDSAASFRWQLDKSNIFFNDIMVDSASASDSTRLLFAKNVAMTAEEVKMKTPDGLYQLLSDKIFYSSASRLLEVKQFSFAPAVSDKQVVKHFGYQHEIYKLKMPTITVKNFQLPNWVSYNKLLADTIDLISPVINVHMDRNARPNTLSKKGQYPHQLLQKAPFDIIVNRLNAKNATVVYTETNDKTQLTGMLNFSSLDGTIDNITNDTNAISRSNQCIVKVQGRIMKSGNINAVFRFNLADKAGAFSVNAGITNLNAAQLQSLGKAMTAAELQSFNLQRIDYTITGNEHAATGRLKMKYKDMDVLINQIEPDKSLDKKGLLSFIANRLVIYKDNPMSGEEERVVEKLVTTRDATKSFFNLVWKTMYSAAGKIVIRPAAERKLTRREQRKQRRALRKAAREKN